MKRLLLPLLLALAAGSGAAADTRGHADEESLAKAARINAQLAVAYLKQNDVAAARDRIERALGQNSRDPDVQSAAGLVYDRLQEAEKADAHYSAAVRIAPNDPSVVNNYAVYQCRRGKWEKGLKLFEQAARNPAYSTPEVAYSNAGVCARDAKNLARAEELFRKALSIRSDFPDALLQMADLTLTRGSTLAARAFLDRYFAVSPASPESLLLAIRVAHKLGDRAAEDKYSDKLEHDFADSDQVRQLREGAGQR
jgi:type IV pilus assembly protein PilF